MTKISLPLKFLSMLLWLASVAPAWAGVYDEILIAARDNRTA